MSFSVSTTRCSVFNEFSPEEQQKYFSLSRDKVIFNIDSLYYTVKLFEVKEHIDPMLEQLKLWKDDYNSGNQNILYKDMSYIPFHFCHYEHCLRIENMFDIFISSYLPNDDTPRIVIQLRSVGLWLKGAEVLISESFEQLTDFLSCFGIRADIAKVNRIDYAFHHNLIQNSAKYFNDTVLLNNLVTKMRIYQKVGNITDTVEIDYLCLGNRKSNNIFFRTYNKTREVIEKNYKGFFVELWFKRGLISAYDKYCLDAAYKAGTYSALYIARIDWYLTFGHDDALKHQLSELRCKCYECSDNYTFIKKKLHNLLPEVTTIMNAEFQTKTKFFKSIQGTLSRLPDGVFEDVAPELRQIVRITRNSKLITDYLTSETVCFCENINEKNKQYLNWWQRIRDCKVDTIFRGELLRQYCNNLDMERLKQRMITAVAGISAYKNNINNQDLTDDVADFLCVLNDNDVCNITIDPDTGERLEFKYRNYDQIKNRKQRQVKPLLQKVSNEYGNDIEG